MKKSGVCPFFFYVFFIVVNFLCPGVLKVRAIVSN